MRAARARSALAVLPSLALAACVGAELDDSAAATDAWAERASPAVGGALIVDPATGRMFHAGLRPFSFGEPIPATGIPMLLTDLESGATVEVSSDLGNGDPGLGFVSGAATGGKAYLAWAARSQGIYLASFPTDASLASAALIAGREAPRWVDRPRDASQWEVLGVHVPVVAAAPDGRVAVVYRLDVDQKTATYGGEPVAPGRYPRVVARWLAPDGSIFPPVDQDPIRLFDDAPVGADSQTGSACQLDAAFGPDGTLHAAAACDRTFPGQAADATLYYGTVNATGQVVRAAPSGRDKKWGNPDLAVAGDGSVYLVWAETTDTTTAGWDENPCAPGAGRAWLAKVAGPGAGGAPTVALTLPPRQTMTHVSAAVGADGALVIAAGASRTVYAQGSRGQMPATIDEVACDTGVPTGDGTVTGVERIAVTETRDGIQFTPPATLWFFANNALTGESEVRALTPSPATGEIVALFSTSGFDPRPPATPAPERPTPPPATWLLHLP